MNNIIKPNSWKLISIGDLADILYGKSLKETSKNKGDFPVYSSGGIMSYTDTPLCKEDSIIIGRKGNVGSIYISKTPFWCIDTTFYLKNILPIVDIEYLAFALKMINLKRFSIVVGVPGISKKDIERQIFPLPTIPEQKEIIKILQQTDRLKELRDEIDLKKKNLIQAIFNKMFSEPAGDWIECQLKDVISLEAGKNFAAQSHPASKDKWGILKVSAITQGIFLPDENKELFDNEDFNQNYQVNEGDLLITRANTQELVGTSAIVEENKNNLILPDKIWRAIFNQKYYCNPLFLFGLLNTQKLRYEVSKRATGTSSSMKNISQRNFLEIEINLPPLEKQDQFGEIVKKLQKDIFEKQKEVSNKIKDLQSTLSIKAFMGHLTQSFRQNENFAISTYAKQRDETLKIKSGVFPLIKQITNEIENITSYLSNEQKEIFESIESKEGYFLGEDDFSNLDLPPNQIQRNLELFAELGLIKSVNIPIAPGEIGKVFFTTAYRSLKEGDDTKDIDLMGLEKQANI